MIALHLLLPIVRSITWPWSVAGVLPLLAGGAAVRGERDCKRAGTPVRPFEPSSALVEAGPFRFSRGAARAIRSSPAGAAPGQPETLLACFSRLRRRAPAASRLSDSTRIENAIAK